MDLNLVTGQPGASKTLNTIKEVERRRVEEARPVFYANIKGLKLPWQQMPEPDALQEDDTLITPHSWFNAPPGAIIVIDEAQDYFPAMSATAKQPEYIMRMAKFRHSGYSMYLITQGPSLINSKIKEWVQPHTHYRRLWGGNRVVKFVNEGCIDNPRSTTVSKNAIRSVIKIDKSMFDVYESAVMHNENKRFNKKLFLLFVVPLILVPVLAFVAVNFFKAKADAARGEDSAEQADMATQTATGNTPLPPLLMDGDSASYGGQTQFNPLVAYQPRIQAMPETAPAYDDLRRPQTVPKPQCLINRQRDTCTCYTQQATLMQDYPDELCRTYATRGYFDPTKRDKEPPPPETRKETAPETPTMAQTAMPSINLNLSPLAGLPSLDGAAATAAN